MFSSYLGKVAIVRFGKTASCGGIGYDVNSLHPAMEIDSSLWRESDADGSKDRSPQQ